VDTGGGGSTEIKQFDKLYPQEVILEQNYPNPFNPETNIQFNVAKSGYVQLKVYNLSGQEVATLLSKNMTPGTHTASFSAANLCSGTYFYTLQVGDSITAKKMIVLK